MKSPFRLRPGFVLALLTALVLAPLAARAQSFTMYAADFNAGTISKVTADGTVSLFASGSGNPLCLAMDATGNLYVGNDSTTTVEKITPAGAVSTFASGIQTPSALAFDGGGNLYVVDLFSDISKVTPAGAVSAFATGFSGAKSLAFDAAGNLYVSQNSLDIVSKVTPAGAVSTFASGFNVIRGLAFDAAGNLYVANTGGNTVSKVTPAGVVSTFASGLTAPQGLAFDGNGNLYVANSDRIAKITPDGTVSTFASGFGSVTGLVIVSSPAIINQPQNQNFVNDRASSVNLQVGVSGLCFFQWQVSADGGATWTTLANNATYSGVTSATLTVTGATHAMSGDEYECVATNSLGSATSHPATLTAVPFFMYVANGGNGTVSKVTPSGAVSTFASGFSSPVGLALDASDNLYLSDWPTGIVAKITPTGAVSTFASGFSSPEGLGFDSAGNLYVAQTGSGFVAEVASSGTITTYGLNSSQLSFPTLLAVGPGGNVYVSSAGGENVAAITPAGVSSTFASSVGDPQGLAFDTAGNLYVADSTSGHVFRVTPAGSVSIFASGLSQPGGLAFDGSGNLYVANGGTTGTISKITPSGVVSTFASGFNAPYGIVILSAPASILTQPANNGFVTGRTESVNFSVGATGDFGTNTFQWQVSTNGGTNWTALSNNSTYGGATSATLTVSNPTPAMSGYEYDCVVTNGLGTATSNPATLTSVPFLIYAANLDGTIDQITPAGDVSVIASGFQAPYAIAFDETGNLYVANYGDTTVAKITPTGSVSTFASGLNGPNGLAFDLNGNLYVANFSDNTISKITPAGTVSTFASGLTNPAGLAFDASGNLYVANYGGTTVSKITPDGAISTFASGFNVPAALAFDHSGNLLVANYGDNTVSKVTPAGVVSTFASGFSGPNYVAFDRSGNLYVANDGGTISMVTPAGVVSTLASGLSEPVALAILSAQPTITAQPISLTAGAGQTAVFSLTATGTGTLSYQWNFNGTALSGATDRYLVLGNVQSANAGGYTCTVTDSSGSTTSYAATLTVSSSTDLGRIMNMSVRNNDGPGDSQLIAGFVIGGPGTTSTNKSLLVRGDGPLLSGFGLAGLPDPLLKLFQPSVSTTVAFASNQGWNNSSTITSVGTAVGAYPLAAGSLDSALAPSLAPGAYTANVTGASGDTGVALAEIYDATTSFTSTTPRLINVSGRCQVGTGANQLIAGFVIGGSTEKTVLVRGDGPLLASLGLTGTLPDPMVQVFQPSVSTTVPLASNTVWGGDAAITSVASAVGAYPFASSGSADSALLISLPPGVYTANVTGASGDTGIALVEVYEVP